MISTQIIDGIPNARAVQLDVMDEKNLSQFISEVGVSLYFLSGLIFSIDNNVS